MGTVSTMLLLMLVAGEPPAAGVPLTLDELQIAVAALEENLGNLRTIEARYRIQFDDAPGYVPPSSVGPPPGPAVKHWLWKPPRISVARSSLDAPDIPLQKVIYDGRRTFDWNYDPEVAGHVRRVSIIPNAPLEDFLFTNFLAYAVGVRAAGVEGGLLTLIRLASDRGTISGRHADANWTIELGSQTYNRADLELEVDLDPTHDFRLARVRWITPKSSEGNKPHVSEYVTDEFQLVQDGAGGEGVWFPLHARYVMLRQIITIDVDEVRINVDIADDRFAYYEPPSGTEIYEVAVAGGPGRTYLSGGDAAVQQRMAEIVEETEQERERVAAEGVSFDATSPTSNRSLLWFGVGVAILVIAWVFHRARSR